ncbi:MAG: hypothetical protein Q8O30_04450 [Candidatus Omnitrophota bacterium]|nr:hypothetical protein [Candidatus Omnitrophota bacterium]
MSMDIRGFLKMFNIAVIFMLIWVFLCQGFVYSADDSYLRVPVGRQNTHERIIKTMQYSVLMGWESRGTRSMPDDTKSHNLGLLLEAFNVPFDALVIEHGSGPFTAGIIPSSYRYRLAMDIRMEETEKPDELRIKGGVVDTPEIIQKHVIPADWPGIPQAIVWCNFWYYLKAYAPKGQPNEIISQKAADAALQTVNRLLPEGGIFIVIENQEEELNEIKERIYRLGLPYDAIYMMHASSDRQGALVFRKSNELLMDFYERNLRGCL